MEENKRQNIILTADDFGKSAHANRNILRLANLGKLERVSVMADGDFEAGKIEELSRFARSGKARKDTGVALDIHLELDWQKKRRGKLRDSAARQGIVFLVNHLQASRRKRILPDWEGQIEKFRELFGRVPDGINSHEYVHLFPAYFKTALDLAGKFSIPFVRFGKSGLLGKRNAKSMILNNLRKMDKKKFVESRIDSSDHFASLDWIRDIEKFFKNLPDGKTEIACHPEREEELKLIEKYF